MGFTSPPKEDFFALKKPDGFGQHAASRPPKAPVGTTSKETMETRSYVKKI
jgi:hypothetical protein